MKKNVIIILLILILVIVIAGFAYNYLNSYNNQKDTQNQNEENVQKAVDFTVYDREDKEVTLSSLYGKPVILNFWASWCGPCMNEMPDYQKIYDEYGDDVNFMIVNLTDGSRETQSSAMSFINENNYTFPVYFDKNMEAATEYGIRSIPTTYIIDSDGFIVKYNVGMMSEEELIEILKNLK